MKVWCDGEIGDAHACRISILDHGVLYGDGVFEGIRITGARVFRLGDHLARLRCSASAIGLELPHSISTIRDIVLNTARAFGQAEAYVRLVVTRGVGELSLDPLSCADPQLFCIVAELRMFPIATQRNGLRLMTSALRRPRADVLDPQVKSLNYLNNVLAKREARLKGFDDALLLNLDGRVAEASGANIFAVIDDVLTTPPTSDGALPGLTRDTVMHCHRQAAGKVDVRPLTRYDVLVASEVFLCGSGAGLIAVAALDDCVIGAHDRPVVQQLLVQYDGYARANGTPL